MAFLAAVGKFLAQEIIKHLGERELAEGRRIFSEELAKGTPQKEAARIAATQMMKRWAEQGGGRAMQVAGAAARSAGRAAGSVAKKGADAVRNKLKKQ